MVWAGAAFTASPNSGLPGGPRPGALLCFLDRRQPDDLAAVVLHDERVLIQFDLCGRRDRPGTAAFGIDLEVDDGKVVAFFGFAPGTPAPTNTSGLSATMVRSRPSPVARSIVKRVGVSLPAPIRTVPVGGTPTSFFRSASAPPALNAATSGSASLWDILRSTVTVTGALADAPPAPLTAAVAVNTSAAPCPRGDHGRHQHCGRKHGRTNCSA